MSAVRASAGATPAARAAQPASLRDATSPADHDRRPTGRRPGSGGRPDGGSATRRRLRSRCRAQPLHPGAVERRVGLQRVRQPAIDGGADPPEVADQERRQQRRQRRDRDRDRVEERRASPRSVSPTPAMMNENSPIWPSDSAVCTAVGMP